MRIDATPLPGDPLEEVLQGAGTKAGVLSIDLPTRRRLRLSCEAERRLDGIYVRSCQLYANCPEYIQIREPRTSGTEPGLQDGHAVSSGTY